MVDKHHFLDMQTLVYKDEKFQIKPEKRKLQMELYRDEVIFSVSFPLIFSQISFSL